MLARSVFLPILMAFLFPDSFTQAALPVLQNPMRGDMLVLEDEMPSSGLVQRLSQASIRHLVSAEGELDFDATSGWIQKLAGLRGDSDLWMARAAFSNWAEISLSAEAAHALAQVGNILPLAQALLLWQSRMPGRFDGVILHLSGDLPLGFSLVELQQKFRKERLKLGVSLSESMLRRTVAQKSWVPDFVVVRLELPMDLKAAKAVVRLMQEWSVPYHLEMTDFQELPERTDSGNAGLKAHFWGVQILGFQGESGFEVTPDFLRQMRKQLNLLGAFHFAGVSLRTRRLSPRFLLQDREGEVGVSFREENNYQSIFISQNSPHPAGNLPDDAGITLELSRECHLDSVSSRTARFEVLPAWEGRRIVRFMMPGLGSFGEQAVGGLGLKRNPACSLLACAWIRPHGSSEYCSSCHPGCALKQPPVRVNP